MMDLHIHTVYSDGELTPKMILELGEHVRQISVTDHNSVGMALSLSELARQDRFIADSLDGFIVGAEVTVEGYPDLLVYYPQVTLQNIDALSELELHLQKVRIDEETDVKEAYHRLGFSEWEIDKKNAFPAYTRVAEARTRELASICYMKRTGSGKSSGYFESEDLRKARIMRRGVENDLRRIKTNPYTLVESTGGELVLAHPIRTAIKYADRGTDYNVLVECLDRLIVEFLKKGGKIVEWEYLECESNCDFSRYPVLRGQCKNIRKHMRGIIDTYSLLCVWGSDTHKIHPLNYEVWDMHSYVELEKYLPSWAKATLCPIEKTRP